RRGAQEIRRRSEHPSIALRLELETAGLRGMENLTDMELRKSKLQQVQQAQLLEKETSSLAVGKDC
ncbi:hypothetical protein R2R70_18820, partial [Cobetia sp. SIMBA_158]|uniref:hypothetical protein n=1 Tax=Cobetia sp. SIMBA_158 TaxID=3081617 RepID=UPI00397FA35B